MNTKTTTRQELLEKYKAGFGMLQQALNAVPAGAIDFYPAPGKWSVRQIVLHIADSEANSYIRCRKGIAESGSAVVAYDQDRWAEKLNYAGSSIEDAMTLTGLLRSMNYKMIETLPEEAWSTHYMHPESGLNTLEDWFVNYITHMEVHLKQIQRNMDAWKAAGN